MKNLGLAIAILLAAPPARAQDNATGSSGHDPNAAPALHAVEIEGPAGAQAARHDRTFGIGFGQTPSSLVGLEAEYYLGNLMLDGTFGFDLFAPKDGDSLSIIGAGAAVFYRFKTWDDVALMVGGRLELLHVSAGGTNPGLGNPQSYRYDATQIDVEVPLRAELYFSKVLAVHGEVAAVLAFVTDGVGVVGTEIAVKGTYFAVPLTNLIGDFGVTFFLP